MSFLGRVFQWNTVVVSVCASVVALCLFGSTHLISAQDSSWTSASDPYFSLGEKVTSSLFTPGNTDCLESNLQTQILQTAQSLAPIEQSVSACVVRNGLGTFSGGYVSPGTHYAYKVTSTGSLVGIPNQPLFMVLDSSGEAYGKRIYEYSDVRTNGTFQLENSNLYRGYTYQLSGNRPQPFKDSSGQTIKVNNYAFSNNGKWMVVEAMYTGFVRINTLTGEMVLFSDAYFTYNQGYLPSPTFAISDDGNTVIASGKDAFQATLFDISSCTGGPFSMYSRPTTGCKKKQIQNYLTSKVSGYQFLHSMRFDSTGRTIKGVVIKTGAAGNEKYSFTLSLDQIAATQPSSYVALGDSFASGEGDQEGVAWYVPGSDERKTNMCHLSRRSYPYLISDLVQVNEFHSVACSGAKQENILTTLQYGKSTSYLDEWTPGKFTQVSRLEGLEPSFITVSIGGNDLGFANILSECALNGTCSYAADQTKRGELATRIAMQFTQLKDTYKQLADTTKNKTKIYVIGYPQFIKENGGSCGINVHLNDEERVFIASSVHYTNQVIKAAADAAGITYIDIENSLESRNLCSIVDDNKMAVNGLTEGNDKKAPWYAVAADLSPGHVLTQTFGIANESYHPNQIGHELMKDAILEKTGGNPLTFQTCTAASEPICPRSNTKIPLPDPSYFGNSAYQDISFMNTGTYTVPVVSKPEQRNILKESSIDRGIELQLQDMSALSTVEVTIYSTPTRLGSFKTDANGTLSILLNIPGTVPPGKHTIHAVGKNFAGELVDYFQEIYILGPGGDINNNGVADIYEPCGFVEPAHIDRDKDGIDDSCDSTIGSTPSDPVVVVIPVDPGNYPEIKVGLGESSPTAQISVVEGIQESTIGPAVTNPTPVLRVFSPVSEVSHLASPVTAVTDLNVLGAEAGASSVATRVAKGMQKTGSPVIFFGVFGIMFVGVGAAAIRFWRLR